MSDTSSSGPDVVLIGAGIMSATTQSYSPCASIQDLWRGELSPPALMLSAVPAPITRCALD